MYAHLFSLLYCELPDVRNDEVDLCIDVIEYLSINYGLKSP